MPLTDTDFNEFAKTITRRFAQRSKGLDDGNRRIIGVRPADQILAGFLTPVKEEAETDLDEETALANDLPRDSDYEQTAMGFEWIAPLAEMQSTAVVQLELTLCVFVRRLPTFQEQDARKVWERQKGKPAHSNPTGASATIRQSEVIQVWTRETLLPMQIEINLGELKNKGKLAKDLSAEVLAWWHKVDKSNVFPGRHELRVSETDLSSAEAYATKLATFPAPSMPLRWRPWIDVRSVAMPTEPGCVRIALRVVNRSDVVPQQNLDYADHNLYAFDLRASLPQAAHRMAIFQELPASFRYDREMYGIGINAHVEGQRKADRIHLAIDSIPTKQIDRLEPREVENAKPRFDELATNPIPILQRILADMRRYDSEDWAEKISSLQGIEQEDARKAQERFQQEIARFERGVQLLADETYANVRRAFSLMNQAMSDAARGSYEEWRLFQIVFIVSQLSALAAREHPELSLPDDDHVDVLWFAAGGGKTEAFLGLILWQAFFDRLRGKQFGVTAYVRFPLRLLAFQQLRRLGRALAAAEVIRKRETLGGARFSIGDYVGSNVTPNRIYDETHNRFKSRGVDKRYQRIFECPFCRAAVQLEYDADLRLIKHVCSAKCKNGADRLPLYIVDTDLYRFLPTVIVSTVDKIALLGYNQQFANLFGRFDLICPKHGASFKGINKKECAAAKAWGEGRREETCEGQKVRYGPFHDPAPALLIQDELHLLSEDVGAFDAHYETAVMQLARSLGAKPWKIIAATATIEEYEQHAWELYLKRARQFPGPGTGAYESFYYRQNPERIGRIFVGVLGIGRKHTPAVTRTLSNVYLELQAARELAEADLPAAIIRYGTRAITLEEFRKLIFFYELPLTYVLTRKGSDQVAEAIESRVKKDLQDLSPQHGELLVDMFNGGVDVSEMTAAMQRISSATPEGDPAERIRGLVATSIIGHGVDVDRFNIIVFAGFTRLVAEYIQASARVGRTYPGISIFVAAPQNERDRSVFDRFAKFHEYLDRLVDPSAVTRWPNPIVRRTVPGLLAGYLMGVASYQTRTPLATVEDIQKYHARAGFEALTEAEIVAWMELAYGADKAQNSEKYQELLSQWVSNTYRLIINTTSYAGGRPRQLGNHLDAMQSLRDVDDPAFVKVTYPRDKSIIKRLTNG
jgi:hypothetical protein